MRSTIERLGQEILNSLLHWASRLKLRFSYEKSQALLIPIGKKYVSLPPSLYIDHFKIPYRSSLKILGIIIDSKLTWTSHISYLKEKTNVFTAALSRVARLNWGLPCTALKTIYKSTLERIFVYAVGAWLPTSPSSKILSLLDSVQRSPALRISRAYRTTSTAALQVISGLEPLSLVASREAAFYRYLRGTAVPSLFNNQSIPPVGMDFNVQWNLHPAVQPIITWTKVSLSEDLQSQYSLFTDGSKNDTGSMYVGCSFIVFKNNIEYFSQSFSLPKYASIFQAEAVAILKAIHWISDNHILRAKLFTDSQSVLQALQSSSCSDSIILQIKLQLLEFNNSDKELKFFYIKAHAGFNGNERADFFAKKASLYLSNFYKNIKLSQSILKTRLKAQSLQIWQNRWINSAKGRWTYKFFPTVSYDMKTDSSLLTQFITGHGRCPEYLHRIGVLQSSTCPCGFVYGDFLHYISSCPLTAHLRRFDVEIQSVGDLHDWFKKVQNSPIQIQYLLDIIKFCQQMDL